MRSRHIFAAVVCLAVTFQASTSSAQRPCHPHPGGFQMANPNPYELYGWYYVSPYQLALPPAGRESQAQQQHIAALPRMRRSSDIFEKKKDIEEKLDNLLEGKEKNTKDQESSQVTEPPAQESAVSQKEVASSSPEPSQCPEPSRQQRPDCPELRDQQRHDPCHQPTRPEYNNDPFRPWGGYGGDIPGY